MVTTVDQRPEAHGAPANTRMVACRPARRPLMTALRSGAVEEYWQAGIALARKVAITALGTTKYKLLQFG